MGLGLACTLPPGTGWLSCTSSEQRTCDCYFSQPGHFLFLPFVVRPSGNRCQCRYRTRRSACVCSRGAPLHHTSSCCDVGLDSTSPHSLQESPPRRSPPSPTACGTHFVCDSFAVLFFFFVVWCLTGPLSASGWVGIKFFFLAVQRRLRRTLSVCVASNCWLVGTFCRWV